MVYEKNLEVASLLVLKFLLRYLRFSYEGKKEKKCITVESCASSSCVAMGVRVGKVNWREPSKMRTDQKTISLFFFFRSSVSARTLFCCFAFYSSQFISLSLYVHVNLWTVILFTSRKIENRIDKKRTSRKKSLLLCSVLIRLFMDCWDLCEAQRHAMRKEKQDSCRLRLRKFFFFFFSLYI